MTREWGQEDARASRWPLSWQTLPDLGASTYLGLMPSALLWRPAHGPLEL